LALLRGGPGGPEGERTFYLGTAHRHIPDKYAKICDAGFFYHLGGQVFDFRLGFGKGFIRFFDISESLEGSAFIVPETCIIWI